MKILWFPRLQFDIDRFHMTTWREMCSELERLGHDVEIAIAGKYDKDVFDRKYIPVPVVRKKALRILSFWVNGFIRFIQSYFRLKPDVVILDWYSIWFSLPLVFIRSSKRAVMIIDSRAPLHKLTTPRSLSNTIFKFYTWTCLLYCKHFMDGMTVITSYYKKKVCGDLKLDSSLVGVWSSGVNISNFSRKKLENIERPPFLRGKFVLMQHGEISYDRGYLETLKALNIVRKRDVCLVLIGNSINRSKVKDEIDRLSRELGLEENIYVLPPVAHPKIPEYISYCDCAIMAYPNIEYWNHNNPIKLLEYLAMGKVVICTDMWTFNDVMGKEKCACYIKDDSPAAIAEAITYCYENRESLPEWGRSGTRIIRERYTWQRQAENLVDFIESLRRKR